MLFSVWWATTGGSSRGLCASQPLNEYLAGEGASKKSEWVSLTEDAMKAFEALKQACMTAPVLVFADCTKPFLLETDASKDGLGVVLSQKQGRQVVPPHCLWQQSSDTSQEKLSLHQTKGSGIKMGSDRAL